MEQEQYLRAIRHHFDYLFDQHGFRATVVNSARQSEYCLIVLESAKCKVKFHIEQDVPECYIGTLKAPSNWDKKEDGLEGWYLINPILSFLSRKRPELAVPWPTKPGAWTAEDILKAYSAKLRPFVSDLISAFESGLTVEWWSEYRADFEEQVRTRKKKNA